MVLYRGVAMIIYIPLYRSPKAIPMKIYVSPLEVVVTLMSLQWVPMSLEYRR